MLKLSSVLAVAACSLATAFLAPVTATLFSPWY
jgi:hypothetical protein